MDVPSYSNIAGDEIRSLLKQRTPFVLRQQDIGSCITTWTNVDYLIDKIGADRSIVAHVGESPLFDFLSKNFIYKTMEFQEFIGMCNDEQGRQTRPANIDIDFPSVCADLSLPNWLERDSLFSSILRIASPRVQIWTHYDVLDNVLIQVVGSKRVVLYPPSDVDFLYMKGDKSQVLDIDRPDLHRFPEFARASPQSTVLQPGDALYIPALWFHNTRSETFSIGVNAFWQHLQANMFDKKDIYGNRDVLPAQKAMSNIDQAVKHLSAVPECHRDFYGRIMIEKIRENLLK